MAFFSGLKAAYDSIGSEINKTFDSSKDGGAQDISTSPEEHSDTTTPQPLDKASKLGEVESVPSSTHTTPSKEGETKALSTNQHRKEESDPFMSNWGEWEQQTTRQNRIKSPSLKQTQPSTSSLSPELADSRETTPILKTTSHSTVVGTPSNEGGISADLPGTSSDDKSKLPLATSTPSRMQSSSSSSGKSQLDNLSREDLIKYVRKQGLLLQMSKNRCEDLTKECERLKEMGGGSKNAEEGGGVLGEELQVVRSERDSAVMEGKSLRQTVTQLGNEKQDLADRLEALNDAHSKLKQLFQERQSTTTSSEQEPTPPSPEEKVTESRSENQTLESMVTSLKQQLEEGGLEFSNQLEQLKKDKQSVESKYADLLRRAKKLQTELKSSREKIVSQEPLNEEKIKALEGKNEQLVSDLATARQDLQTNQERFVLDSDGLKKKMEDTELACSQFKQRLVESEGREKDLRKELEEVSSKVILVGNDLAATKVGEENLKKKLEETKSELTALERSHATSVESEESLNKELEELRSKYSQLEANFTKRALDDNALKEELKELTLRNSQLEQSLLAEKKRGESDGNVVQEENQGRAMELEDKCQQLVCQLEDAQEKLAEMEARVKSTEQDKALAQEKLAEMEARVKSTEQDKALAQEKLVEMEARVKSTEQDKALAQEKLAEMEARVESTEQDKALAQEKLAEMEAKTEDKFRNSEGEKAILQDKLDEMEATVTNVEKEKALTQEKELPEIEARIKNIEQDNSLLQDNLTKKDSQLKEMDSSLKSTMEELESARRVNSEASEMMRSERARFESELSRISSSNVDLEGRLKTQTDEVKAMGIKLTELEQRCVHKDQQLSTADEELANLRSLLESREKDLNDQLKEAVSLKAELEQRCDHKDQQLSTADEELANLRSLLESREKDLNDQLKEVVSLKAEKEEMKQRVNKESKDHVDGNTSENLVLQERSNLECERLNETLASMEVTVEEREGEKEALKKEIEELRATLEKEAASHKEESRKLKAFAIKLKKELTETRERESSTTQKQLQEAKASSDEIRELKSKLSEEMEKLKQTHSSQTAVLQAKNDEASSLIGQLSAEGSRLQLRVIELEDGREVMQSELASLQADLATVTSEGNAQKMATESALSEVRASKEDLEKERGAHRETKQKLGLLEKEAKSSSLMSMELEDYQKSIRAMEGGLAGKEQQLEETRRTSLLHQDSLQQLRKDMDSVTLQKTQSEETVIKLKQLVMKNKKEVVEGRRKEEELQKTISELQTQLEEERQGSEMAKMEASQITARIQSIKQQSEQSLGNLQRAHRTLEQRYALAQGELTTTKTALTNTKTDYENYKVRVHSVLKQKSTGPGQAQINTEIKQKYESELVKLTTELQEVKSRFSSSQADHEDLLLEHEQLSSRHEQLLQEAEERRERLEKAMKDEASRHSLQSQEQTELIIQLRHEMEEMAVIFKTQLNSLQEEHAKVVSSLKEDLEAAHANLSRLQHEVDSRVLAKSTASSVTHPEGGSHLPNMEVKKIPNEQRSSGEGMEQSELDSTTSSIPPTPLFEDTSLSFERLLSAGESDVGSNQKQALLVSASEGNLRKQLKAALKKIKHLTELLRENEASSLRLSDQAKLLKEEIRRLERNKEREKEVANMEYLKNIVLKFLHDGSERTALIPIIEKLLLLSPKEVKYLEDTIVKGKPSKLPDADPEGGAPSAKNTNWSSYVHRWTGY